MVTEIGHTIDRMYGISPYYMMYFSNINCVEIRSAKPSVKMLTELQDLPRNTTIGIQYFNPQGLDEQTKQLAACYAYPDPQMTEYWQSLIEACQAFGLKNIVYLEDIDLNKKSTIKTIEAKAYRKERELLLARGRSGRSNQSKNLYLITRGCYEMEYASEVQAEYLSTIKGREKIMENILKYQPQIVIMKRDSFAEYLIADPDYLINHNLQIDSYRREHLSQETISLLPDTTDKDKVEPVIMEDTTPMRWPIAANELLLRRYRAITEGRILADQTPDFIGTLEPDCRTRGLFEVYINKDRAKSSMEKFFGLLVDGYGTANLEGRVDKNKLTCEAKYQPGQSARTGYIAFEGFKTRNGYKGMYYIDDGPEGQHPFILNQGSRLRNFVKHY